MWEAGQTPSYVFVSKGLNMIFAMDPQNPSVCKCLMGPQRTTVPVHGDYSDVTQFWGPLVKNPSGPLA